MAATVVTLAEFRTIMAGTPFADSAIYEDPLVEFWLEVAEMRHNADRWKSMLKKAICLYVAHELTLDAVSARAVAAGGIGGLRNGLIQSESGDSVSVSFDVTGASEGDQAGYFNSTLYGKRWYHLMRLFGAGPLVAGTGGGACGLWPGLGTTY